MAAVIAKPGTEEKLRILSADSQYDLACACGSNADDRRHRGTDGKWVYPVSLPNGGKSVLFKTLVSNICINDCKYCPLRAGQDLRRCSLEPDETAKVFLDYYKRRKVFGLFLSSGVGGSADAAMERLNATARILRSRYRFRGFIHLKVMAGASDAAITEAVSLANAVSLNIETPGAKHLAKLSGRKDYLRDIIEPIKLISRLTGKGNRYCRVKQTTQFVVGAADESDAEIVKYMGGLYDRLNMERVYFSAYQQGLGDGALDEKLLPRKDPAKVFVREHRLYQVDFLLRKYGFKADEIGFDSDGKLSMEFDPKEQWARNHPERFPIQVNRAGRDELLRVPGLGPVTVGRILQRRKCGHLKRIEDLGKAGVLLNKANEYLVF